MSKPVFIALTLPILLSQPVSAAISNQVNISTNTGGNTINNQQTDTNINTGSTSTSVSINNNYDSKTASDSSTTKTQSQTTVKLDTHGKGTMEVRIVENGEKFELFQKDDQSFIKTTDSRGNVTERPLPSGEQLTIIVDSNNTVRVEPAGPEFSIIHNKTRVYVDHPVAVDQNTKQLQITINGQTKTLATLPEPARTVIEQHLDDYNSHIAIDLFQDQLSYQTSGTDEKKLLGFFQIKIPKHITVSAENGSLLQTQTQGFINQLLDKLST